MKREFLRCILGDDSYNKLLFICEYEGADPNDYFRSNYLDHYLTDNNMTLITELIKERHKEIQKEYLEEIKGCAPMEVSL